MNGKLRFLAVISLLLLQVSGGVAEEPSNTGAEVAKWKADMAEASFSLAGTLENRGALIFGYESLVHERCMRDLPRTLDYDPKQSAKACEKEIDRLLELNPENPVAICARDGIENFGCREAYAKQKIVAANFGSGLPHLIANMGPIGHAQREYIASRDPAAYRAVLEKYRVLLNDICKKTFIGVEAQAARTQPEATPVKPGTEKSFSDIEKKLGVTPSSETQSPVEETAPTAEEDEDLLPFNPNAAAPEGGTAAPEEYVRIRRLPQDCFEVVHRALDFDPKHFVSVCFNEGFFSPNCIDALREERKRLVAEKKAKQLADQKKPKGDSNDTPKESDGPNIFKQF